MNDFDSSGSGEVTTDNHFDRMLNIMKWFLLVVLVLGAGTVASAVYLGSLFL